jgi:hypothetical protein
MPTQGRGHGTRNDEWAQLVALTRMVVGTSLCGQGEKSSSRGVARRTFSWVLLGNPGPRSRWGRDIMKLEADRAVSLLCRGMCAPKA